MNPQEFSPQDDLDALEAQLRESLRKIEEEKKRRELERLAEEQRNKEVTIYARRIYGTSVILELSDIRDDVIAALRTLTGYAAQTTYNKMIHVSAWNEFLRVISELPRVKLEVPDNLKKQIEAALTDPNYLIDINPKSITIKVGFFGSKYKIQSNIPTSTFDTVHQVYKVPIADGWRLVEIFQESDNAIYTEEAKAIIVKQVEDRAKIDVIAKAEDSPSVRQLLREKGEEGIKIAETLRPFQTVDVQFSDITGGRYLNANEMGLGKTIEALCHAYLHDLRTVVICPASLMYNWAREIRKWLNQPSLLLSGSVPDNWTMQKLLIEKPKFVIINYDIISRAQTIEDKTEAGFRTIQERFFWIELINMSQPDLVIIDEAHYIKNVDSNRSRGIRKLKVPRLIFLTGTPVINRPGELWPILTMLRPDEFPHYETFLYQYTYDGKRPRNVEQLKELLRPLMIRRRKKDVIKELPPINRINEYYQLPAKAQRLYDKVLQGVFEIVSSYDPYRAGSEKEVANILVQIMRLKQVCAIGMMDYTADKSVELFDSGSDDNGNSKPHKVLIFSQFKGTAYGIHQRLGGESLCFVSKGPSGFKTAEADERDALVQRFQTDDSIKYLVVTEKTTKEGMNITAAQSVIFNDLFWTPAGHQQAEGRAYGRLSDLHSVTAYYMIFQDTIMDWILELLDFKSGIIEETVEGVEASRDESVAMKLIMKIKNSMWTRGKK